MINTEALEAELMELSFAARRRWSPSLPGPRSLRSWRSRPSTSPSPAGAEVSPSSSSRERAHRQGRRRQHVHRHGRRRRRERRGTAHPKVLDAIKRQCDVIMHTTDITNPKRIELAKKVSVLMPEGLPAIVTRPSTRPAATPLRRRSSSPAAYTGRSQLIAFHGAYHGVWCGTAAMTTAYNYRHGFGPLIPGVQHLPYAYCYRCPFEEYPSCDLQCGTYVDDILTVRTRAPTTSPRWSSRASRARAGTSLRRRSSSR